MKTKLFRLVLFMLLLGGGIPASAAFKDIKIDLTEQWLLTNDEFTQKTNVNFGIIVADNGTISRVEATSTDANAVISGKYYNEHGWAGVTLTIPVEGKVKIGVGNCKFANQTIKVTNAAGTEVTSFATDDRDCWKDHKNNDDYAVFGYYEGSATTLTITTTSYTPYISVEAVKPASNIQERAIINTDFQDWEKIGSSGGAAEITTNFSNENITFNLDGVSLNPTGTNSKFGNATGYMMAEKNKTGVITTSIFNNITKVIYTHAATGSNRGFKLEKKSANDTDWVILSDAVANPASGMTITKEINEDNVQLRWTNLNLTQNAYMLDLQICANVEITARQVTLATKSNPETGGSTSIYPNMKEFDEGTEVQLTATPNFGYKFVNWTDETGNEVSTEAKFKYVLNENTELTANFKEVKTYELTYNVEGGANTYMVQPTPAPTVINGKNMYEEGTTITLTASNNPILTFMNWSTGETSAETKVTMDGNKNITATYSAIDYIVGWDFYNPGNNGRPADFASTADNESTTLILRDAEGNTQGWLDKSTVAAGGYESLAGAAVNWKTDGLGKYYYQTNIKARDFQNIKVQANMMYNYNAYTTQILEYSLDNEKWNEVTRITMAGTKAVSPIVGTLPTDANHAENIYIRWRPDTEGNIDGTESNNDGTVIADIYITADADIYDDGTAPVLKSSVPENGATGASASGKIVLNFDEKVKLTDNAQATLNGEELELAVSGMTVTATYKNLDYATAYEFNLAGNSVSDLAGNTKTDDVKIKFTTMTRPTVEKGLYDKEVTTADEFFDALSAANSRADKSTRYRIFMHNGTYDLCSATLTAISANNISIIGESENGVIIKNTPKEEGIGVSATLFNTSTNLYMQDITIKNDYDYNGSTGRAVCLQDKGNKTIAKRVKLLSYQDTYYSNNSSSRYYWEDSEIHGTVDFLCGGGDVYYNRVNLVVENRSGNVIAAPNGQLKYGYVFLDCEINCPEGAESTVNGSYRLGRPWGANCRAQYINTRMNVIPAADGWGEMGNNKPEVFAEYNSTDKNGLPVDLSSRKTKFDGGTQASAVLSEAQVEELSITNVMGGNDEWNPLTYTEQAQAPANVTIEGSNLTWDNSDYVLLYAICKNGKIVDFTTEPTYTVDDTTAKWAVRAANEMGGLGEATEAVETSGINDISTKAGDVVSTVYYNLQGVRVSKDFNGVVIKVDTMKDGKQIATKIAK